MNSVFNLISSLVNFIAGAGRRYEIEQASTAGIRKFNEGRYGEALPLLKQAAEAGEPDAMAVYGAAFLQGRGVKLDGAQALHWIGKAHEAGSNQACALLGMMYATGMTVKKDVSRARELLSVAAEKGDDCAREMLAVLDGKASEKARALGRKKSPAWVHQQWKG